MKRVRFVPVLVSVLALSAAAIAFVPRAEASTTIPANPAEATIKKAMDEMNAALKVLGGGVTADNKDASLQELEKFEMAVMAAKSQTPESAEKVDEKKRPAFVAEFRKELLDALKLACDVEAAIVDGKYKDADKLIKNKLGAMKSAGHGKFKPD